MEQNLPPIDVKPDTKKPRVCGIVMPISAMPPHYTEKHWQEVIEIIGEAVKAAGFTAKLVSDSATSTVIHGNIVNNLDENEMVVCDVSGKNPNVMFELGLRLAFDKPTVVIKDSITDYNFDTSPIKHLSYDYGLRHQSIITFMETLRSTIVATDELSRRDPSYSPFLGFFSKKPKGLPTVEQSALDYISSSIASLSNQVASLAQRETAAEKTPTKSDYEQFVAKHKLRELISAFSESKETPVDQKQATKALNFILADTRRNALYDAEAVLGPNISPADKFKPL